MTKKLASDIEHIDRIITSASHDEKIDVSSSSWNKLQYEDENVDITIGDSLDKHKYKMNNGVSSTPTSSSLSPSPPKQRPHQQPSVPVVRTNGIVTYVPTPQSKQSSPNNQSHVSPNAARSTHSTPLTHNVPSQPRFEVKSFSTIDEVANNPGICSREQLIRQQRYQYRPSNVALGSVYEQHTNPNVWMHQQRQQQQKENFLREQLIIQQNKFQHQLQIELQKQQQQFQQYQILQQRQQHLQQLQQPVLQSQASPPPPGYLSPPRPASLRKNYRPGKDRNQKQGQKVMVLNSKPSDQQYNRDPPTPRSRNPSLQKDYRPSRRSNVAENAARKRENAKRQEEEEQLLLEELSQLESRQNALMHRVKEDLFKEENVKRNMDNEARKKKK